MRSLYIWATVLGLAVASLAEVSAVNQRVGLSDSLQGSRQQVATVQTDWIQDNAEVALADDDAEASEQPLLVRRALDPSPNIGQCGTCNGNCGTYYWDSKDCDFDCDSNDDDCCTCECYNTSPWGYGNPSDPSWWYHGMLLPNCPTLFPQFMADPRAVNMSAGWRFNDNVFEKNMIDVSYGAPVPLWRWFNVFCYGDAMQIDLEGALWAIFDPLHESSPLVNADYYIGFPLTWKYGCWSWRLRGYHISSHIGDEFLLNHPTFIRKNPSAQYLDFFVANQLTDDIRIFAGYGRLFQVDPTYAVARNYLDWGAETYFPYYNWDGWQYCVLGRPFFGMYFRYWDENNWDQDATYVLGYEVMKLTGMQGKLRAFLEYHNGYSWEGQFSQLKTDYFSLRLSYGY